MGSGGATHRWCPKILLVPKAYRVRKDAILAAFEKTGGEEYLMKVSKSDPKVFCAMLSRLIPAELKLEPDSTMALVLKRNYMGLKEDEGDPEQVVG